MWQFLLNFLVEFLTIENIKKHLINFSAFNFQYTFFWLYIASLKGLYWQWFFWGVGLWCSQKWSDQQEDLARIGYKKNMKEFFSKTLFYIFGYLLEPRIGKIWRFFFEFGRIMAIKIPKNTSVYHFEDIEFWPFFNKKSSGQNMAIENMKKHLMIFSTFNW
jgi:hypothetical protein